MIVGSQSGQYIVAFLNKADAVVPPELHEVIGPYLHKVQERLNSGQQASFPHAAEAESSGWSWPSWLKSTPAAPQLEWPQSPAPSAAQPLGWPAQTQSTAPANAAPANPTFGGPREPNPFPDPYSASRPAGGTF
jgi:hypothetical protein